MGNGSGRRANCGFRSFDAFEAIMERMIGKDDGILDALFIFTAPVTRAH